MLSPLRGALGPLGVAGGSPVASWQVTTTGAATHTIASFTVSAATTVDWGDGSTNTYTGGGARTHDYAGAGTWTVRVLQPLNVTALMLIDNKVTLTSAGIACMTNIATFAATSIKAGTFNSADVAAWRPTTFQLYNIGTLFVGTFNSADVTAWRPTTFWLQSLSSATSFTGTFNSSDVAAWRPTAFQLYFMPTGYAGTFNSADVTAWRPTDFELLSMPAGYAGAFNCADVSAWRPTTFWLYSMPVATFALTVAAADFAAWTTTTNFRMQGNAFSDAQVNAILYGLYQASIAPRTGVNGTINVGGSNAAPSGTYQAAASCPVTVATPGKEVAYELKNDSCGAFANHWATVTTS